MDGIAEPANNGMSPIRGSGSCPSGTTNEINGLGRSS